VIVTVWLPVAVAPYPAPTATATMITAPRIICMSFVWLRICASSACLAFPSRPGWTQATGSDAKS